jgi:hypothetical protein
MESEPDRIDLSMLDPSRHASRWNAAVGNVAARALELRRLRRAVMRRGMIALAMSAAAALLVWMLAPRREVQQPAVVKSTSVDMLDWAERQGDVLELGGGYAQ